MDHYCILGNPIAHSWAPEIHAWFARHTGQDMVLTRQLTPLDGLTRTLQQLRAQGVRGVTIALPFKEQAYRLCDSLTPRARVAGAINLLNMTEQGSYQGDNTDGAGLVRDLTVGHGLSLGEARVLVLGAGGAARGIILALLQAEVAHVHIANRTPSRAQHLVDDFSSALEHVTHQAPKLRRRLSASALDDAQRLAGGWDLIINATPLSLDFGLPEIPRTVFAEAQMAYDLVYAREATPFMQWAQQHGAARCADGLGMLIEQAAEAFALWRGVFPVTTDVLAQVRAGAWPVGN